VLSSLPSSFVVSSGQRWPRKSTIRSFCIRARTMRVCRVCCVIDARLICTICHTDVQSGAVKSFPPMKSFRVNFDHSRHLNMGNVSCATCHKPARGGVAFSIPVSFGAHATCFSCHQPRAKSGDKDISSCGTCHKLGSYSRTPQWTAAFRMNFSHAKHGAERKLNCNECHQIKAGAPQRQQVSAPEPANHHASGRTQSCMTCHDGKRAFGGDDFSVCKRCHTGPAWRF